MNTVASTTDQRTRRSFAALARPWASQIGITVAFLLLWGTFIVLAPGTFLNERIYLAFAQTTPFFALMALPLTMVIVAGDIDLSFPSIMALGMVGFVFAWQRRGVPDSALRPHSPSAPCAACSTARSSPSSESRRSW